MSHTNPPDPPPSLSAAELDPPPAGPWNVPGEAVSRLRLPGQSGTGIPVPPPADLPDIAPPTQTAFPGPGKRSPVIGARIPAADPQAYAGDSGVVTRPPAGGGSGPHGAAGSRFAPAAGGDPADVQRLRTENKELRQLLEDMKHLLQEASDTEQQYAAREADLQAAMAERQRQVDELSAQLREIEEQITNGSLGPQQAVAPPKTKTELEDWADELEQESAKLAQERRKLDDEIRQLREDEEALESQMREMEVSMARERALLARQETELKRLSAEIQHELEAMQRGDAGLREQLQKFQRRAADVMQGRVGGGGPGGPPPGRR